MNFKPFVLRHNFSCLKGYLWLTSSQTEREAEEFLRAQREQTRIVAQQKREAESLEAQLRALEQAQVCSFVRLRYQCSF